ncbi:MAG TPA: hypothetical protein VFW00_08915 [Rhodocyclaceae bacterium]|nr:hypothetical protein [Rhodocyclaceae bacterium]
MNPNSPADDAALSDALLSKADALIRRNRPDGVGSDAEELPLLTEELDDLPQLTEALEDVEILALDDDEDLDELSSAEKIREVSLDGETDVAQFTISQDDVDQAVLVAVKQATEQANMRVAEQLIDFDSYITQALEAWISTELPPLMASEMDGMVERLRLKTLAQMRATLLPELSGKLSALLDATSKPGDSDT